MKTLADQGAQTGKVRKARKPGKCQECRSAIVAGETYVVGSQKDIQHGPHAHQRLCLPCAQEYGLLVARISFTEKGWKILPACNPPESQYCGMCITCKMDGAR